VEGVIFTQLLLLGLAIFFILLNIKYKFFRFKIENIFFDIAIPALISLGLLLLNFTSYMSIFREALLVYLAPITEEIIFRGAFIGGTLKFLNSFKVDDNKVKFLVILFSSFIFTIMHGDFSQSRMIFGLVMGIMFLLYKNNLLPCVIAHYINNAVLFSSM
jgi:membrane protease YdiL (CAAX protease family)